MNRRFFLDNRPLVEPLYYRYPKVEEAYRRRNEYFFGSQLLVSPITQKSDPDTGTGAVKTWLPEGSWYDIFTGLRYRGDRTITLHRTIDSIPVLARAGGILPMEQAETVSSRTDNPTAMQIKIFCGAEGVFTLYEDDGISMQFESGAYVTTEYRLCWEEEKCFRIQSARGDLTLIPEARDYELEFYGAGPDSIRSLTEDGEEKPFRTDYDPERGVLTLWVKEVSVRNNLEVHLREDLKAEPNNLAAAAYRAINRAQIPFATKEALYRLLTGDGETCCKLSTMETMVMPEAMKSLVRELLLAE